MPNMLTNFEIFHGFHDKNAFRFGSLTFRSDTEFTYTMENFFHPFVDDLIEKLNKESLAAMLDPEYHRGLAKRFFSTFYESASDELVKINDLPKEIELRHGGPYANYNWELLFHIPLTIAVHLSKNQRFAEAQRWFHYIFDPTSNDTSIPTPRRFWKFLAFRDAGSSKQIDELLRLLSKPDGECTAEERLLKESILAGYEGIRNHPFQPHRVARTRQLAYQYCVVMKYLDNLIAWGDSLFRQDTIESINEATQRYVLAANLLGERPQRLPSAGTTRPMTFAEMKTRKLDPLGNLLVELEGKFPLNLGLPKAQGTDPDDAGPLLGIGRTLYFCIPRNEKLLGYWDTVADRLFKIRHCMNIEGVVRQLALFDPPLDPGMLVKAAAAGINIGSILSGTNQPAAPVRCLLLIQKALELCGEVRSLGSELLSAIEKGDGERLALLRQSNETRVQEMAREVRFLQWKQAQESTETLLRGRGAALERYRYYRRLLGAPPDDEAAPDTFALERGELTEDNFDETYATLVAQYDRAIARDEFPPLRLRGEGRLHLQSGEDAELHEHADRAQIAKIGATSAEALAAVLSLIPNFNVKMAFWGVGAESQLTGGAFLSNIGRAVSSGFSIWANIEEKQGQNASKTASYERRADEWTLQSNLAARELTQIGRQLIGSLIAEQIAYREYVNVGKQIEQSQEVDRFLREKFTSAELYAWMQGELSRLYYEYYRFAFDTARKAEQTMKRELMRSEVETTDYVKFNYWDGGRKGLLSGQALYLDVKRMELAYHEHNKREYELTRHVSLRQLDPLALLQLKGNASCEFSIPEWLFDLDCPGHYMRRIKSVAVSIPSVTGPYASVPCTLSLVRSSVRESPSLRDDEYPRQGSEDDRFLDAFGPLQSIVTSGGNDDAGLFETNLRDERFLPFEGAGAISTWKLELPSELRQFDYNTISDVILHLRYTARPAGQLREKAVEHVRNRIAAAGASGPAILLSLRHDFPNDWHQFAGEVGTKFSASVTAAHFPYLAQGKPLTFHSMQICRVADDALMPKEVLGADLEALTTEFQEQKAFELSLDEDEVLVRDANAEVFVVVRYAIDAGM